jgi:hypothetical protein
VETADAGRPTGAGTVSVGIAAATGFDVSRQIRAGVDAGSDVDAGIVSGARVVVAIAFEIAVGVWGYDRGVAHVV